MVRTSYKYKFNYPEYYVKATLKSGKRSSKLDNFEEGIKHDYHCKEICIDGANSGNLTLVQTNYDKNWVLFNVKPYSLGCLDFIEKEGKKITITKKQEEINKFSRICLNAALKQIKNINIIKKIKVVDLENIIDNL